MEIPEVELHGVQQHRKVRLTLEKKECMAKMAEEQALRPGEKGSASGERKSAKGPSRKESLDMDIDDNMSEAASTPPPSQPPRSVPRNALLQ